MAYIFSVTKRIHNIIHSLKHKQNPEKKNHQIRTNEGTIAIGAIARCVDRDRNRRRSTRCLDRSLSLSLSLSLSRCVCLLSVFCCVLAECVSLFCACYINRLKVKRLCKMISGSTSVNFGQTEIIF